MKEASSRFVDQLTLEKLLSEKLERVHHFPKASPDVGLVYSFPLFTDWNRFDSLVSQSSAANGMGLAGNGDMQFTSLAESPHLENQQFLVKPFLCADAKVNLVFYHGLFEENREIYNFLISNLNRLGVNVYLSTLPFHYERTPATSVFSGEYFWSACFERTRAAFQQAVYDLHVVARWVSANSELPVMVGGFSMGGSVALIYGAIHSQKSGVVALNPAVSLSEIVWDSPLCRTIKADYIAAGFELAELVRAYREFEPLSYENPATPIEKVFVGYGSYDVITSPALYRSFTAHWGVSSSMEYKCGHQNLLRVPRVANDVWQFWEAQNLR